MLLEGTLGVALVRPDGTIVHASDHARIGRWLRPDRVRDALTGTITSATSSTKIGSGETVKSLESYVPVVADGQTAGVAVITQDYAPIAAAARAAFLPVAGIAEGVVLILFVFLVPMLGRVAKRLTRQLDEIEQLAYHDDLTGLPNRRAFLAEAHRAINGEPEEQAGVILVDLDRFKEVNDTLGHHAGDDLLVQFATRLSAAPQRRRARPPCRRRVRDPVPRPDHDAVVEFAAQLREPLQRAGHARRAGDRRRRPASASPSTPRSTSTPSN